MPPKRKRVTPEEKGTEGPEAKSPKDQYFERLNTVTEREKSSTGSLMIQGIERPEVRMCGVCVRV